MNISTLTNHPVYQKMSPQKQKLLLECAKHSEGVSSENTLPLMLGMLQKMKSSGLSFTKEEREVLTEVLTSELSPADRAKVEMMKKMMH